MSVPDIRLEGVSKFYKNDRRQFAAVADINLTIRQGEFVFVTGSSGAGKSTLLKLICGEIAPSVGKVYLGTKRVDQRRSDERIRASFGKVSQTPQLMRKRTIAENLEVVARTKRGSRGPSVQKRIQKVLSVVDLPDAARKYPVDLSGGECRLVELARANAIPYAVDIYPHYSSDITVAWHAGMDARGALIGPGAHASHGMERTHFEGMKATIDLVALYLELG